jgi:hypothetical protein
VKSQTFFKRKDTMRRPQAKESEQGKLMKIAGKLKPRQEDPVEKWASSHTLKEMMGK